MLDASANTVAAQSLVPRAALGLLPDERLAARAAQGDREAFAVLFRRHHQAVFRYCLALLRNPEDAADVLQTTMLKALQTLAAGRKDLAVRPWLFRVAHNEAISLLRRRGRQVELSEDVASLETVHEASETRSRLTGLLEDLRELPERQRGALLMRELDGLPYERIAEAFETSPAAAKQAVHEARLALTEMDHGRSLACATVTERMSERDGRMLRGRALRAHLRGCERCRSFRDSIAFRKATLAWLPGLAPEKAAALLQTLLGMGGGPGAGTAAAVLSAGAKAGVASLAAKAVAPAAVAIAVALGPGASAPDAPARARADRAVAPVPATVTPNAGGASTREPAAPARPPGATGGTEPEAGGGGSNPESDRAGGARDETSSAAPRPAETAGAAPAPTAPDASGPAATTGGEMWSGGSDAAFPDASDPEWSGSTEPALEPVGAPAPVSEAPAPMPSAPPPASPTEPTGPTSTAPTETPAAPSSSPGETTVPADTGSGFSLSAG